MNSLVGLIRNIREFQGLGSISPTLAIYVQKFEVEDEKGHVVENRCC